MSGWLDRFRRAEPPAPKAPAGARIYCIGDIHGRADLLQELHEAILADATEFCGRKQLVYLGDYVDRGDDSREVLDLLVCGPPEGFDRVCLRGNHEQALLDFLEHPERAAGWLQYGGLATLLSYGVRLPHPPWSDQAGSLSEQFQAAFPGTHLEFLQGLPLHHVAGSYCFVHAGIRPGVPLEKQHPDDLMWIRDDFLAQPAAHEHIVVHGHSITEEPELLPHRIGIDTGAFYSGVLTCLVLENDTQRLLQTHP